MKKKFDLKDLECANCANKMEMAIAEMEGVISVNINFMLQKMTLEVEEDKFDEILKQIIKVCKKIEPNCEIII